MNIIKKWLIEAFGFSKTEINGTWLLLLLIILIAIVPRIYVNHNYQKNQFTAEEREKLENWAQEVENAICLIEEEKPKWKYSKNWNSNEGTENANIFQSNKKANYSNTQKYKSSSSKKYVNQKVYEKIDYGPKYTNENKLNLNMADTAQLQAIKGIGPVLSKRILKYRNSLGGFHSAEQLKDVYGLSPELVETMSDITFTTDSLTKIDINSDSLKYLASHPYIDYRMARSILNFRKVHGNYKAPEDLLKLKLMTDSLYKKLYPYISESQLDF